MRIIASSLVVLALLVLAPVALAVKSGTYGGFKPLVDGRLRQDQTLNFDVKANRMVSFGSLLTCDGTTTMRSHSGSASLKIKDGRLRGKVKEDGAIVRFDFAFKKGVATGTISVSSPECTNTTKLRLTNPPKNGLIGDGD